MKLTIKIIPKKILKDKKKIKAKIHLQTKFTFPYKLYCGCTKATEKLFF